MRRRVTDYHTDSTLPQQAHKRSRLGVVVFFLVCDFMPLQPDR